MAPYTRVRTSAIAGSWYPGNRDELARLVDSYLAAGQAPTRGTEAPLALLLPHAGFRYSGATAGLAAAQVKGLPVRRVWLLGPTHRVALRGVGLYDVEAFQTPLGALPLDQAVVDRLKGRPGFSLLTRGDGGEHSLEIELPILQRALGSFELVPLLMGNVTPAEAHTLATALLEEVGPGDLVVVSSDFTHHGPRFDYQPFKNDDKLAANLDKLDHGAWRFMDAPDAPGLYGYLEETEATICGRNGLVLLMAMLSQKQGARGKEISYTTSGELTGDWDNSVSYLAARFDGPAWSGRGPQAGTARLVAPETARALLSLARQTLETWYKEGRKLEVDPSTLPADATRVLGAFVTLEKHGELRGCIGEIEPKRAAWQAVRDRALDAALKDPRFSPVTADELGEITLDVSLLGPSWKVPGPSDFIVGRHGIVLSSGWSRATFLPQVAPEQGWDRATTLQYLARKAGIPASDIPRSTIEVYEAQVTGEEE